MSWIIFLSWKMRENKLPQFGLHLMQDSDMPVGINCSWFCFAYVPAAPLLSLGT